MNTTPVTASALELPAAYSRDLCLDEAAASAGGTHQAATVARYLSELLELLGHDRIIDWDEAVHRTNLSRRTLQRLMEEDQFPKRVLLSGCRSGWRNSEVERWIRTRPRSTESKK